MYIFLYMLIENQSKPTTIVFAVDMCVWGGCPTSISVLPELKAKKLDLKKYPEKVKKK